MNKPTGGQAFPTTPPSIDQRSGERFNSEEGMTMRQWYAGQALAGMISQALAVGFPISLTVKSAFEYADAMIEEENK